jgi:hypothetical protein
VTGEGCDSKLLGSGSLESGLEDAAESDQKLVSRILFAQPKKQLPPNMIVCESLERARSKIILIVPLA